MLKPIHFLSADRQFGLCIPGSLIKQIFKACSVAGNHETGGILVGKYNKNYNIAEVTSASDIPNDSKTNYASFVRGIKGLGEWLQNLWKHRNYYLGEWHFHPNNSPNPSNIDTRSMMEIAKSRTYHCPEPILLIIGGNPFSGWRMYANVTSKNGWIIPLQQITAI